MRLWGHPDEIVRSLRSGKMGHVVKIIRKTFEAIYERPLGSLSPSIRSDNESKKYMQTTQFEICIKLLKCQEKEKISNWELRNFDSILKHFLYASLRKVDCFFDRYPDWNYDTIS